MDNTQYMRYKNTDKHKKVVATFRSGLVNKINVLYVESVRSKLSEKIVMIYLCICIDGCSWQ